MKYSFPLIAFLFVFGLNVQHLAAQQIINSDKFSSSLIIDWYESEAETFNVLLVIKEQAHVESMQTYIRTNRLNADQRSEYVITNLQSVASATQPGLMAKLRQLEGIDQTSMIEYWVINAVEFTANRQALSNMSDWDEIGLIELTGDFEIDLPVSTETATSVPNGREWGHDLINAPAMWALGYTGYGRKALIMDSGVDPNHYALMTNFWGHNVPVDHAWSGFGGYADYCGDHGPHVTGTIIGLARYNNDTIGVAFNAHWMGGPMNLTSCSETPFDQEVRPTLQVFEWALNPDGDPTTAGDMPDALNCSWRNANYSCDNESVITLINNMYTAGIAVVFSGGNTGPEAGTVCCAAAYNFSLVNTFAVGAVNISSTIAGFSSRGPSGCEAAPGPLSIKPEVVAPGVAIRSSVSGNGYSNYNGTSMAAPHATGAVLLLKEAFPYLDGETILLALYFSAADLGVAGEDNVYGNGLIDVFAAYEYLIAEGNVPVPPVSAENDIVLVELISQNSPYCKNTFSPAITVQNAGFDTVFNFTVRYFFETDSTIEAEFLWEGILPTGHIVNIPLGLIEDLDLGIHVMIAEVSEPNGVEDLRDLNNRFKKRVEILELERIPALTADLFTEIICDSSFVSLEVKEIYQENQQIKWYNAPSGGNLLGEGPVYVTGPVTSPFSVYADLITVNEAGKSSDMVSDFMYSQNDQVGLIFDAFQEFRLKSVTIHANTPGVRFLQLRNGADNLIASRNISIPEAGTHVITLNLDIPAGNGLRLLKTLGQPLGINYNEQNFPFETEGIVSIYSSVGLNNEFLNNTSYHYFYDWVIETNHACGRTEIQINAGEGTAFPLEIQASTTEIELVDGIAQINFSAVTEDADLFEWNFGNYTYGTGNSAVATYTMPGNYTVALTALNQDGCANAAFVNIEVTGGTVNTGQVVNNSLPVFIYPNPANDLIYISIAGKLQQSLDIQIIDITGRVVNFFHLEINGGEALPKDISQLAAGAYALVAINPEGKQWSGRFVKH